MGAPRKTREPTPTELQDARLRRARVPDTRDTEVNLEPPSFDSPLMHKRKQDSALYRLGVRLMGVALSCGLYLAPALLVRMSGAKVPLAMLLRGSLPVSLALTVLTLGIFRSWTRAGLLAVPLAYFGGLWACDVLGIGSGPGPKDFLAKVARPHELIFGLLWNKSLNAHGSGLLWAALGAGAAVAFLWQFAIRPALAPKQV